MGRDVWETVSMANLINRVPKKGDRVHSHPLNATFLVASVDRAAKTVDLQPLKAKKQVGAIETGIPWSTLTFLDELDSSQNALRIVRESTEGK